MTGQARTLALQSTPPTTGLIAIGKTKSAGDSEKVDRALGTQNENNPKQACGC